VFVGATRIAQVEALLEDFRRVAARREPAMVVLVAAPGSGKTRIVQEFYRKLAAGQTGPAYWPPSLLDESPDHGLGLAELTASRKTVRHRGSVIPPPEAEIPWVWLAPAAGRLSDGSPAPAFDGLVSQFTPHVAALLRRLETAGAPDPVRLEEIKAAVADLGTGTARSGERPEQLSGLMSWLLASDGDGAAVAVILVLDDAHELDEPTVGFVRELLASEVPVLIIATTWPDRLTPVGGRPLSPFCCYAAEAGGSNRTAQRWLGELEEDDLVGYIVSQFPATDQKVAASLVSRADRNPYALRLLLNTPRVSGSIRHGAISLDPREIADLNGRLEKLLEEHWDQLPTGARHVLVAAALLGQSFVDEVLEAGLRKLHTTAGLDDALASSWIRPLGGSDRILEFAERLRYDIARGDAPNFLSAREREDILNGALRALRRLLPVEPDGTGRVVLLALHVLLARESAEDDLAAAAVSAAELGERARSEYRRLEGIDYYRQAIAWTESSWAGVAKPAPIGQLVRYLVEHSTLNRIQYGRPAGEPSALRAVQLAEKDLDPEDEWFTRTADEAARLRVLREDEDDLNRYSIALQRQGEALACLRQADGIAFLDDAMDVRETGLAQDHSFWAVRQCAKSLWWAYQRLGRASEAGAVARRYRFTGDPSDWVPAFVPRL
jgi:hypothetical protein